MTRLLLSLSILLGLIASPAATAADENPFREDARSIEALINANYAYLDRLEGGKMPLSAKLRAEADAVADKRGLLRYAERALAVLADHHAITGSSFPDSWGLVPSHADLWIEPRAGAFVITAVKPLSPAAAAGIPRGAVLEAIGGVAAAQAVRDFWTDLGLAVTPERAGYAARVLAAGRRDRTRRLSIRTDGALRQVELPHVSSIRKDRPPVTLDESGKVPAIRFNDSLGEDATVAAFDAAMAKLSGRRRIVLDLTDTPGGGNTMVARAVLGWFVDRPSSYQIHNLPAEKRQTGIARQWVEQVLPREGKRYRGQVEVHVGRWTGSMGEGMAIAFDSLGAYVAGGPMAGLLGAIYDYRLEHSGLVLKLPTERLFTVDGIPREAFVPRHPLP